MYLFYISNSKLTSILVYLATIRYLTINSHAQNVRNSHCRMFSVYEDFCVCVPVCSVVPDSLRAPWTKVRQNPLPMEFSRQEYWIALLFPTPGALPNPVPNPLLLWKLLYLPLKGCMKQTEE